jgi:hypothetical protein
MSQDNIIEQRRKEFTQFVQEEFEVVGDFFERIGLPDPNSFTDDAEKFVSPLNEWLRDQMVTDDSRIWLLTCLGYFIGELFSQRYDGKWLLEEDASSPYFGNYVVGDFKKLPIKSSRISPFASANNLVNQSPGRSLMSTIEKIDDGLRKLIS